MSAPVRIQLSRAKGWRMPENTVKVDRSTRWGNPYRLDDPHAPWSHHPWLSRERASALVEHYRRAIEEGFVLVPYTYLSPEDHGEDWHSSGAHRVHDVAPKYLRGKNLACWCALDAPCHADVLLEIANRPVCEAVS